MFVVETTKAGTGKVSLYNANGYRLRTWEGKSDTLPELRAWLVAQGHVEITKRDLRKITG